MIEVGQIALQFAKRDAGEIELHELSKRTLAEPERMRYIGCIAVSTALCQEGYHYMNVTTALRVVEKDTMDKQKAIDAALSQIERAFGKAQS